MRFLFVLMLFCFGFLVSGNAMACRMDAPAVTDNDIAYPPEGMIALRAEITEIIYHGRFEAKPHDGFRLKLKTVKVMQGNDFDDLIEVEYGGCHNLPGKVGDVINVLALKNSKKGWYAPQFWKRKE